MNYIVLDMEWNQPLSFNSSAYKQTGGKLLFEILQFGAIKLDEQRLMIDSFSQMIQPSCYLTLHPQVKRITGITRDDLAGEPSFSEAFEAFEKWCGEDYAILTWGGDDISVLYQNIAYFQCENHLGPFFDIQELLNQLTGNQKERKSLAAAMEYFQIKPDEDKPFHNALHDAYYTALVFAAFPESADLVATPLTPRELSHDANKGRSQRTMHTPAATVEASLLLDSIRTPSCPICAKKQALAADYLRQGENRYMALAVCPNHGLMNVRIRFLQDEDGKQRIEQCVQLAGKKDKAYIATKILQWQNKLAAQSEESPECS